MTELGSHLMTIAGALMGVGGLGLIGSKSHHDELPPDTGMARQAYGSSWVSEHWNRLVSFETSRVVDWRRLTLTRYREHRVYEASVVLFVLGVVSYIVGWVLS